MDQIISLQKEIQELSKRYDNDKLNKNGRIRELEAELALLNEKEEKVAASQI